MTKSEIFGASDKTKVGLEYVGTEEFILIAPVSKSGSGGTLGGTTPIVKSDMVGAAFIAKVGLV